MVVRIAVQGWTGQGCRFKCVKPGWGFLRPCLWLLCLSLVLLTSACSTLNIAPRTPGDSGWKTRKRSPIVTAMRDPNTWVPAAAALVIAATDSDQKISDWATDHHPVFGSQNGAQNASDQLRGILASSALATSLVAPGQQDVWLSGRSGSLTTAAAAAFTTSQVTGAIKDSSGRTRPNDVDQRSFPSSHSSAASTYATISAYRARELPLSLGYRQTLKTSFHLMAAATAWSRVEANAHYPTDVLAGYALGNFSAVLLHETFQGARRRPIVLGINRDQHHHAFQFFIRIPF